MYKGSSSHTVSYTLNVRPARVCSLIKLNSGKYSGLKTCQEIKNFQKIFRKLWIYLNLLLLSM